MIDTSGSDEGRAKKTISILIKNDPTAASVAWFRNYVGERILAEKVKYDGKIVYFAVTSNGIRTRYFVTVAAERKDLDEIDWLMAKMGYSVG